VLAHERLELANDERRLLTVSALPRFTPTRVLRSLGTKKAGVAWVPAFFFQSMTYDEQTSALTWART
jgi:hypothetical protein